MMKMVILMSLFFLGVLNGQEMEYEISLDVKEGQIMGTLLIPNSNEQVPLVIIISGSGPTDRDGNNPLMRNNSLKMLAEGLCANDIASLRFDKRGIAASKSSKIQEFELRFENFVEDTKKWIDKLKKDSRFSEIVVLGHSEGSTIGMIASQQSEVTKFISLAGPGFRASDKLKEQIKTNSPYIEEYAFPIIDSLDNGKITENIPPALLSIFRPSVQPYLVSWFKYDPLKEIKKLGKPILIIQGTTDIQITTRDAERLAKENKNARKCIIEGMNHVLKEAEKERGKNILTYNNPDLPLKKGLVDVIVRFIYEEKLD